MSYALVNVLQERYRGLHVISAVTAGGCGGLGGIVVSLALAQLFAGLVSQDLYRQ